MSEKDLVNHPPHYTTHPSGVEVIELTRLLPFGPGNAVKYVLRRGLKNDEAEDLAKALWYIDDCHQHEGDTTYKITPKIQKVAQKIIEAEDNEYVVSFLKALCIDEHSEDYRQPNLAVAGGAVTMLLRELLR